MVPEPIILSRLELQLLLNILHPLIHLSKTQLVHLDVVVLLFVGLLQAHDLLFAQVDLILVLLDLVLGLLIHLLLIIGPVLLLLAHLLDLLSLGVVDVALAGDLFLG